MKRNQEEFFCEAPWLRGQYNDKRMKINKKNKIRRKKFVEEVRGREEEMINLEDDSNIENGKWRKNYEKFINEGSKCAGRTIMKEGES